MTRILFMLTCLSLLWAFGASAGEGMRVVRSDDYTAWKRFEMQSDRVQAQTRLIAERARSEAVERQLREVELQRRRDAATPQGERTLGRACIYGRMDEVLYQPEGRDC